MLERKKVEAERAIIVGVKSIEQKEEEVQEYLKELAFLTKTAGAKPIEQFTQQLKNPNPKTFIGSGKLNEIKEFIKEHNIDTVIFDEELTPSQMRNVEKLLKCKIMDRANLILDIFAKRAKTARAKTQVELAQYEYLLPRLQECGPTWKDNAAVLEQKVREKEKLRPTGVLYAIKSPG